LKEARANLVGKFDSQITMPTDISTFDIHKLETPEFTYVGQISSSDGKPQGFGLKYEPAACKVYEGWFVNGFKDTGGAAGEGK
jgi:hypothetical protein